MEVSEQIVEMKDALLGQIGGFKADLERIDEKTSQMQRQVDAIDVSTKERVGFGGGEPTFDSILMQDDRLIGAYFSGDSRPHGVDRGN